MPQDPPTFNSIDAASAAVSLDTLEEGRVKRFDPINSSNETKLQAKTTTNSTTETSNSNRASEASAPRLRSGEVVTAKNTLRSNSIGFVVASHRGTAESPPTAATAAAAVAPDAQATAVSPVERDKDAARQDVFVDAHLVPDGPTDSLQPVQIDPEFDPNENAATNAALPRLRSSSPEPSVASSTKSYIQFRLRLSKKWLPWIAVVIAFAIGAVAGICGIGACSSKSSSNPQVNAPTVSGPMPLSSNPPSVTTAANLNRTLAPTSVNTTQPPTNAPSSSNTSAPSSTRAPTVPIPPLNSVPTVSAPKIRAPRTKPAPAPLALVKAPAADALLKPTPRPPSTIPPAVTTPRATVAPVETATPTTPKAPMPAVVEAPIPTAEELSPQPTTASPVVGTDRRDEIVSFINGITLSGLELVGQELELAEEKALLWLIDTDDLEFTTANEARFRQRYALATLWFQTGITPWSANTDKWLSTEVECAWAGVTCSTFESGNTASTTVEELKLPGSGLTGSLPPDLGLITTLTIINLANNVLIGTLPDALGSWKLLEQVYLNNNQLSGPISTSATSWPKLQRLWLAGNEFTGAIPDALGANWPELSNINFSTNQFADQLPTTIGLWSNMEYIDLSNNAFTRQLPREIETWVNVKFFDVSDNQLSSEIPAEIGSAWQNVLEVRVQQNNFTGALAEGFCERSVNVTVDCGEVTCSCCAAPACYALLFGR